MERVFSKRVFTWIHKKSGVEKTLASDHDEGNAADWQAEEKDTDDFRVSLGRTIDLGNFAFARVGMGVKFSLPKGVGISEREETFDRALSAVREVLAREEASIRGEDHEFSAIDLDLGVRRGIWIDYGQTVPGAARFESHRIDFTASENLADGEDAEKVLEALQEELGQKIADQMALIKGEKADVGL